MVSPCRMKESSRIFGRGTVGGFQSQIGGNCDWNPATIREDWTSPDGSTGCFYFFNEPLPFSIDHIPSIAEKKSGVNAGKIFLKNASIQAIFFSGFFLSLKNIFAENLTKKKEFLFFLLHKPAINHLSLRIYDRIEYGALRIFTGAEYERIFANGVVE